MDPLFTFHTSFTVRVGDINYGGHMGNDRFLLLFHDTRIRFLEHLGFSEMDIGRGAGLIMTEAHVNYRAEVFMGDELEVGAGIAGLQNVRFTVEFRVERTSDHREVATGYTRMAAFDRRNRKICKIPGEFATQVQLHKDSFKSA